MKNVAILCRSIGRRCGVGEAALYLASHLGVEAVASPSDLPDVAKIVIVELEHSLYNFNREEALAEFRSLQEEGRKVIVNYHSVPLGNESWVEDLKECATVGGRIVPAVEGTFYLPLVGPPPLTEADPGAPDHLHLGSFGFCGPHKRYDLLIELAIRLDVPLTLFAANNGPWENILNDLRNMAAGHDSIQVVGDYLPIDEVLRRLRGCSHLISTVQEYSGISLGPQSGSSASFRAMASVGRPFICLRHWRADEVDAIQVDSLDEITVDWLKAQTKLPSYDNGLHYYYELIDQIRGIAPADSH